MWEPEPNQQLLIELAAECEGISSGRFIELATLAVAEYKLRKKVEQLIKLTARLPKEMKVCVWDEVHAISLVLGFHYQQGIKTLPELDDKDEEIDI